MNYDKLTELGKKLQATDIESISVGELYQLLSKATGSIGRNTLKRYMQVMKDQGFIRFNNGLWEIVRNTDIKDIK